ncbi:MAG: ribonucleotide reductase N-terminal alpha domain-containing protein [Candidatus Micrarchaeota archaeon]
MISKVRKRDGKILPFDKEKITNAIFKAAESVGGKNRAESERVADLVVKMIDEKFKEDYVPSVEDIQDIVEKALIEAGHAATAKAYILYRHRKNVEREMKKMLGVQDDLKLSINSIQVLERRYLLKDENGKVIETPSQLFKRVAKYIASNETAYGGDEATVKEYEQAFFQIMTNFEFLPNSPTLMNAGTGVGQLAACFVLPVEDDIDGIFDAVKYTAIIHKSGGGCIKKGSRIFSTFCGSERIERIYEHFENDTNVINEENASYIDITKENLKVPSFDKNCGRMLFKPVEKVWKYVLPSEKTFVIQCKGEYRAETSEWHPFFVFDNGEIKEKRADELKAGDSIIMSNQSIKEDWPYKENRIVENLELDEEMAWLTGLFSTDGSLDETVNGLRLRWFSAEQEIIDKALSIIEKKTGKRYATTVDTRSKHPVTRITVCNKILIAAIKSLNRDLVGRKEISVRIPAQIFKSPLGIIGAYLAGVMDGDGYVADKKRQIEITGASKEFSEDLSSMFYLFGIKSRHRRRVDKRNAEWLELHEIAISDRLSLKRFADMVLPYITLERKKSRLAAHLKGSHSSIPTRLDFSVIEPFLNEAGINTRNSEIWRRSIRVGKKKFFLARWKEKGKISLVKAEALIRALLEMNLSQESKEKLKALLNILPNILTVKIVHRNKTGTETEFYDFTVSDTSNYLAGNMGLAVIHNTGFSFSRLRPRGDLVKSTAGVASGPLSFMRIFDVATDVVKQGGKRRGANMGVLDVWHPDIEDFITMKQTPGVFENFNVSVAVTEEFMKAVEANAEFKLRNPRNGQPIREINARSLFKLIAYSAWKSAEPGVLFIDEMNRTNPTPLYKIFATNPCLSGDALITTNSGLVRIDKLHNPHEVLTIDGGYHKISWAGKTGEKEVFQVSTEDGHKICATSDHKFFVDGSGWKVLSELKKGDRLVVQKERGMDNSAIKNIENIGLREVFDATEPITHSFFANGILVHNCGEVPMPDFESCNLGSINLEKFVDLDWTRGDWKKKVNWKRMRYVVRLAVQFLDNVIDLNKYPIPEIKKRTQHNRRMGLGMMGFSKMLYKMGIRYDSPQALDAAENLMKYVTDEARKMSHELGRARGSFPGFKDSVWAGKYDAMRNATVTSIAPTGTISMIANTSSGIEPNFALAYIKEVMDGTKLYYSEDVFEHVLKIRGLYTPELMQEVIENGGIQEIADMPKELKEVFVIAYDIKAEAHVKIQAAFQKYTDLAVSKTINMPAEASVEDVENAYMTAWKLGCKGITIYRDGSRGAGVFRKVKKTDILPKPEMDAKA